MEVFARLVAGATILWPSATLLRLQRHLDSDVCTLYEPSEARPASGPVPGFDGAQPPPRGRRTAAARRPAIRQPVAVRRILGEGILNFFRARQACPGRAQDGGFARGN